jgi:alanyl-tRNA synthetase
MCVSVVNLGEFRLVSVVANVLGDIFPELKQSEERIRKMIQVEEESFSRNLFKVRIDMHEDILWVVTFWSP